MDERFHFWGDPVQVVFNDPSFLQMLDKYGKGIRAVIRGADGMPVGQSPDHSFNTTLAPATVVTPYRDIIRELVASGAFPCAGEINMPSHVKYTAPFELRPLVPYTLDIELTPPNAAAAVEKPFFRRAFTTSRYQNLKAFAQVMMGAETRHRALRQLPAGLPVPSGGAESVSMPDREFDQILIDAGMLGDVAPDQVGFTVLWSRSGSDFRPYGILVRASEPLWRTRTEVEKKKVLDGKMNVIDAAFEINEFVQKPSLVLTGDAAEGVVRHFIHNATGTLTLALLRSEVFDTTPRPVSLIAKQPRSAFYGIPTDTVEHIIRLKISEVAPWEE
jgi:hypothetical protein